MLAQYITDTQNLLQSPGAPVGLYTQANLILWINKARGQIAAQARCIRRQGTVATVIGRREYQFASIAVDTTPTSVQGVLDVRSIQYTVASGTKRLYTKAWEWFDAYMLNNPVPQQGPPKTWAQFAQGSSTTSPPGSGAFTTGIASGSFWIDPPPDLIYTLTCDCACYPINLNVEGDYDAIPWLWSEAVPYLAAYYALMSAQTGQRLQEAQQMKQMYDEFAQRARDGATPDVNRYLFEQTQDPTMAQKLSSGPAQAPGGA